MYILINKQSSDSVGEGGGLIQEFDLKCMYDLVQNFTRMDFDEKLKGMEENLVSVSL
jgi:hypothetical protein